MLYLRPLYLIALAYSAVMIHTGTCLIAYADVLKVGCEFPGAARNISFRAEPDLNVERFCQYYYGKMALTSEFRSARESPFQLNFSVDADGRCRNFVLGRSSGKPDLDDRMKTLALKTGPLVTAFYLAQLQAGQERPLKSNIRLSLNAGKFYQVTAGKTVLMWPQEESR